MQFRRPVSHAFLGLVEFSLQNPHPLASLGTSSRGCLNNRGFLRTHVHTCHGQNVLQYGALRDARQPLKVPEFKGVLAPIVKGAVLPRERCPHTHTHEFRPWLTMTSCIWVCLVIVVVVVLLQGDTVDGQHPALDENRWFIPQRFHPSQRVHCP